MLKPTIYHQMVIKGDYFEAFLTAGLSTVNNMDLQSLQVARKHSPFSVVQGRQVFRTRLAKNARSKVDKVTTHVHGANGGIAIEEKFAYS